MKSLLSQWEVRVVSSLFTVIKFTFMNKLKSKAFLITSMILIVILSVVINLPYIIQLFSSDEPKQIGIFEDSSEVTQRLHTYLDHQEHKDVELVFIAPAENQQQNERIIRDQIASGQVDGFLEFIQSEEENRFPQIIYKSDSSLDFSIQNVLRNALNTIKTELAIQDLALTDEQRNRLFSPIQIETVQISVTSGAQREDKTESQMFLAYGLVYVLIILFFMGTMISGQMIATEITAEKSSRVMEILVTSVAPLKQMFGKIIGMLLLGLSQIVIFVVVTVVNIALPHNVNILNDFNINLGDAQTSLFIYFIVFYLLGYFLYATIFAAVGSLVSRTEDLGQAIMPVTFLSLAAFYIGIFGMAQPTSTFMTSMSFVPFFTPITMFIRIGMADPAGWEIALSLIILMATIFIMGWLSAKIYRTGVLMYGKRPSIKEIRKAMKAFRV